MTKYRKLFASMLGVLFVLALITLPMVFTSEDSVGLVEVALVVSLFGLLGFLIHSLSQKAVGRSEESGNDQELPFSLQVVTIFKHVAIFIFILALFLAAILYFVV